MENALKSGAENCVWWCGEASAGSDTNQWYVVVKIRIIINFQLLYNTMNF
jgi:hypothetical protein